jgi:hypothetical protein
MIRNLFSLLFRSSVCCWFYTEQTPFFTVMALIDRSILSRPAPLRFPLCADHVPFEMVASAALLWRWSCGGGGQIVFLFLATIIGIKEGAVYCTVHEITCRRGGGGLDNLLMSMMASNWITQIRKSEWFIEQWGEMGSSRNRATFLKYMFTNLRFRNIYAPHCTTCRAQNRLQ